MGDIPNKGRHSVERQADMFRLAERDCGLSIKTISTLTGIPCSTLKGWRGGSAMPLWGGCALLEAGVPAHLLSMLGDPFGVNLGANEQGDHDLDDVAASAAKFLSLYAAARHPEGPGGIAIVPQERGQLVEAAAHLRVVSRKAA